MDQREVIIFQIEINNNTFGKILSTSRERIWDFSCDNEEFKWNSNANNNEKFNEANRIDYNSLLSHNHKANLNKIYIEEEDSKFTRNSRFNSRID